MWKRQQVNPLNIHNCGFDNVVKDRMNSFISNIRKDDFWLISNLEGCNHTNIEQQSVVTVLYGIIMMVAINPVNANIMFHFYLYLCYFLFSSAFVIWNFEFLSHQGQIHKSFLYIMYVKCRYVTKKPNQTPLYVICIAYLSEACTAATLTEQWYSC